MSQETTPAEVHAIAGKILDLLGEHIACSEPVLIAALKVTAVTVEETRSAHFGAQLQSSLLNQYRKR